MCDWVSVSDIRTCLSRVNMSACVWVNVSSVRLGNSRVARWLLTRMDGWMWTSLSRSFHSDWADSSVWDAVVILLVWCALQPLPLMDHSEPPSCHDYVCGCRMVISENTTLAVCTETWGPLRWINAHLSTWVDVQLLPQLYSSLRQVVFFKNKCRKTSAEMWSHAAHAHYKWFLSAGGYLLAPVTCCFLLQTAS